MVTPFDKALSVLVLGVVGFLLSNFHILTLTPDQLTVLGGIITAVVVYMVPNKSV